MADLISSCLFNLIRGDEGIDNIQWLVNIVKAYEKLSGCDNDGIRR